MVVDLRRRSWHFTGEDGQEFPFDLVEGLEGLDISTLIVELSDSEAKQLEAFLDAHVPRLKGSPGLTHSMEHRIDVGDAALIKQRYRSFTPIIRDWVYREFGKIVGNSRKLKTKPPLTCAR